jgi:hypothetical protein
MSSITVSDLRLSSVWVAAFPVDAPTPQLGDNVDYRRAVKGARSGQGKWVLPWLKGHRPYFWEYYLEIKNLEGVDGVRAWKHLMPLRVPSPVKIEAPPGLRVAVEGLCYPHSVAVIVTIILNEELSLDQMVDKAVRAHRSRYRVTWRQDRSTGRLSLRSLASQILDRLHETMFPQGAPPQPPLGQPFTVATVVDSQGAELDKPIHPQDEIHQALEGLCTLDPHWRTRPLHPLNQFTDLQFRDKGHAPPGYLLYGPGRSRAVWFPGWFQEHYEDYLYEGEKLHALGCYHRNLTAVTVQTESLLALVRRAADYLDRQDRLPFYAEALTRSAAGALGRLYGGQGTYRSWSARAQIDPHRAVVEQMRQRLHFSDPQLHSG